MKEKIAKTVRKNRRDNLKSLISHQQKPGNDSFVVQNSAEEIAEIVLLTTYPPRECGIATYSKDLERALKIKFGNSFKLRILPLEDTKGEHRYSGNIKDTLDTKSEFDYLKHAHALNSDDKVNLIVVQHEFGLFKRNEPAFFDFLEAICKPLIVVFHTVLPNPENTLKENVLHISSASDKVIVMTETSAEILNRDYGIARDHLAVIPHGTHSVCHNDESSLKEKYKLTDRLVLSTFGLLGPGKSIETTLDALPEIIAQFPETTFLILGKTHPTLREKNGEIYRELLERKVEQLGLTEHVRFVNEFLDLDVLLEYLQLTDIYLFTSKDPNQAVSGTFSYALSCGCPVISTPIPHALEVLQNKAGLIFDFEDSSQLAQAVIDLLGDADLRKAMRLNGLRHIAESTWDNSAIAHGKVFESVSDIKLAYQNPAINLDHLKEMTTEVGIIQFSVIDRPNLDSGYTLDDNARALIAMCRYVEIKGVDADADLLKIYFNFVKKCFRPNAMYLNYVDEHLRFTTQNDEVNLEDANGRAIWSLGYLISITPLLPQSFDGILFNSQRLFEDSLKVVENFHSPRAMAFVLKGLFYFDKNRTNHRITQLTEILADRLMAMYRHEASSDWAWFEGYLTYGNSVLPQALLMAFSITGNEDYKEVAKESFDFLLSKIFFDGRIRVISNKDWLKRGNTLPSDFQGGEQPIDISYTVLALKTFYEVFEDEQYAIKMKQAFDWFVGNNPQNRTIYNPCTGGCYDGLELHNVNLNQGAESTISYLLARMAFENPSA